MIVGRSEQAAIGSSAMYREQWAGSLQPPQAKGPGGRPSKYHRAFAKQAKKLCELGATDRDLAEVFEVDTTTIWRWRSQYREFCNALKVGKSLADDRVERSHISARLDTRLMRPR